MNKFILNIIVVLSFFSLSLAATESYKYGGALDWYGYNSLLSTEMFSGSSIGGEDENELQRKRRHRRRRKIGPSNGKKGW